MATLDRPSRNRRQQLPRGREVPLRYEGGPGPDMAACPGIPGAGRGEALPPLDKVGRRIIGEGELTDGPFGPHRVTYARCTASGRPLDFIEDFIRGAVLPCGGRGVVADDLHLACGLG